MGWWEPTGLGQLYLIISNQEHAFCSGPAELQPAHWYQLVFSWQGGDKGRCLIFVNGEQIADAPLRLVGDYGLDGDVFLASDRGSTDRRPRESRMKISAVKWLAATLDETDVLADLARTLGGVPQSKEYRHRWLLDKGTGAPVSRPMGNRVLFEEGLDWSYSTAAADSLVDRAARAGFNVLIPCVWHGAGTSYPSTRAPRALLRPTDPDVDVLAYLITLAHQRGIEVHPWITVARRDRDFLDEYSPKGTPPGAFNLQDPGFRELIVGLVEELLSSYSVDGLNLDYVRTMGFCTTAKCQQEYAKVNGRELLIDIATRGSDATAAAALRQWQDSAVGDLIRHVAARRDALRPSAVISVDGHIHRRGEVYAADGRNEIAWLDAGLVDTVFDMNYSALVDEERLRSLMKEFPSPRIIPLFANYDRIEGTATSRSGPVVNALAYLAQGLPGNRSVAFYLSNMLTTEQANSLRNGAFATSAPAAWRLERSGLTP
ncbi:MAG: family 10 glycosylhydrolase [Steroidobacteraceae bacterium]